jgi:hypothetical protein
VNNHHGGQNSPLGAKFTPRAKLHPWGSTIVVKNWPLLPMYADRQIYKLFKCRATARKLADFVTYDRRVDSPAFPRIFFYSEKVDLVPKAWTHS